MTRIRLTSDSERKSHWKICVRPDSDSVVNMWLDSEWTHDLTSSLSGKCLTRCSFQLKNWDSTQTQWTSRESDSEWKTRDSTNKNKLVSESVTPKSSLVGSLSWYWLSSVKICITSCKDQPPTPLTALMKKEGEKEVKLALQGYVSHLRKGEIFRQKLHLGLTFFFLAVNVIMWCVFMS